MTSDNGDALENDEFSSRRSPSMSPLLRRNARGSTRAKSRRKHSHRPALSDVVSGASYRARERADKRQNQMLQAPRNASVLPNETVLLMSPMHPLFGVGSTFYKQPAALIQGPNNMLSSPLGQHILSYEFPRGFVMLAFTMLDGSNDTCSTTNKQ